MQRSTRLIFSAAFIYLLLSAGATLFIIIHKSPVRNDAQAQFDQEARVARAARVKRRLKEMTDCNGSEPVLLPPGCQYMQEVQSRPECSPFFHFDGKYPSSWPESAKLPADTCLLLRSSIGPAQSDDPSAIRFYARGITRVQPSEVRKSISEQAAGCGWELTEDSVPQSSPQSGIDERTSVFQLAHWVEGSQAEERELMAFDMGSGGKGLATGMSLAKCDYLTIDFRDYQDMQGWLMFDLTLERSDRLRKSNPEQAEAYVRYLEGRGTPSTTCVTAR